MRADALATGVIAGGGTLMTLISAASARQRRTVVNRRPRQESDSGDFVDRARRLGVRLRDLRPTPGQVIPVGAAAAVLAAALSSVVPILVVGVGLAAPWWMHRLALRRAARALDEAVPALASSISRSLRVGLSLTQAIRRAVEARPELAGIARRLDAGDTPVSAFTARGDGSGDDVASLLALIDVGGHVGGQLAAAFDALAAAIADRRDVDSEIRALTSQARASMVMLAALPFFSAGLVGLIEPGVWAFLFGSVTGGLCLAAAVGLDAVALTWMASLIRGVQ